MMELKIGDEKTKEEFLLGAFPNKIVMTVQNPFHLSSFTQQFNFALLQFLIWFQIVLSYLLISSSNVLLKH